jgi:hypothetical protein
LEALLTLAYTAFFCFLILKLPFFDLGINRKLLIGVFLLKVGCGYALFYVYTYYYPKREEADIFKFFDDSKILFNSIYSNPLHYFQILTGIYWHPEELTVYLSKMKWWYTKIYAEQYNESRIMIRLNAFFRLFSLGYFHVHTVFICFLSLSGLTALFRSVSHFNINKIALFVSIFCIPSVLFWGSGVLKESLVLFLLGYLLYYYLKLTRKVRIQDVLVFLIVLYLLVISKAYIVLCLLPGLAAYFWVLKTNNKSSFLKFIIVNLLFFLILFNLKIIWPKLDLVHIICFKRGEYIYLAERINTGSLVAHNYLKFNIWSIIKESPISFFTVLFRPRIFEAKTILILFSAIENLMILLLLILSIWNGGLKKIKDPLLLCFLNFVILLFTLVGLTTPVLGSIVRYKIPALPFLMIALLMVINNQKLRKRFPFLG